MKTAAQVRASLLVVVAALGKALNVDPAELLPGYTFGAGAGRQLAKTKLTTKEAAEFLGYSPKTLENWRSTGSGPRSKKIGSRHVYDVDDLRIFQTGRTERNSKLGKRVKKKRKRSL